MSIAAMAIILTIASMALVAGFFHAFSNTVMKALDRCDPRAAIAAMQHINRMVLNPMFLPPFLFAPFAAWITAALLLGEDAQVAAAWIGAAGVVHALGVIAPTMAVNVPMNQALDRHADPLDTATARMIWGAFSPRWTRWNGVRTLFAMIALLLAATGALVRPDAAPKQASVTAGAAAR
jgi:uncharacterized membrane protein